MFIGYRWNHKYSCNFVNKKTTDLKKKKALLVDYTATVGTHLKLASEHLPLHYNQR